MTLNDQLPLRIVLYEGDGAQPLAAADRFAAITALLERGYSVTCATGDGRIAPHNRAAWLVLGRFDGGPAPAAGEAAGAVALRFCDLGDAGADRVVALVETACTEMQARRPGAWKPWFPVIDYDRCTNCMQCLSFCLFGVYGVDEQARIQVQHSDHCKTNCPACSRVCPEAAIMFPKYKSGPINGDAVTDADLRREKMKVDISALLGGDIYALLRQRSDQARARFSKERDEKTALQERRNCLTKLASAGDIPPEVLMSLPSPEEILRRAEEAKARAQAALAARPT